jgi:hypothetical protein
MTGDGTLSDQELCLALMHADTEGAVIELLDAHGYWSDPAAWRFIGDTDSNFNTIGNQQSDPVAALAEKFVNSIDSRLTNACLEANVDPKGYDAPQTMREAVARFFENAPNPKADHVGRMADWGDAKIREEARLLTLAATGERKHKPCLTIADVGEGQTPDGVPITFMSLDKRNKVDIHFVQGKFNMGGTGALYSCGQKKIQLLVTRRNPELLRDGASVRDGQWSFTVTRLESIGGRTPVFTYLAPVSVGAGRDGGVLAFTADSMPILPEASKTERGAYVRHAAHGALIKLYEYDVNQRSNLVFTRQGLRQKLETRLPELALPVGIFECRPFQGAEGQSFFTPARGTATRLDQEKNEDQLEFPPIGDLLNLNGCDIVMKVYAFKRKPGQKARDGFLADYAQGGGVLYVVNGQTHAQAGSDFFRRTNVGLDYLRNDLLVVVDCSGVDEVTRADLFMNSRDRNRVTASWKQLERMVERSLKANGTLEALAIRRREEAIRARTDDDKALVDLIGAVLKASPDLAKVLLGGARLPSPFPKEGTGPKRPAKDFVGKQFPTFFHFEKHRPNEDRKRGAEVGRDLRVAFTTDARDDYFWRRSDRGSMTVTLTWNDETTEVSAANLALRSGTARWTTDLPDGVRVGDVLTYDFDVTDPLRDEPFHNRLQVEIMPRNERQSGSDRRRRNKANSGDGDNNSEAGLGLPEVQPVHRGDPEWDSLEFDDASALAIRRRPGVDGGGSYDFFYNAENDSLLRAQKARPIDADLERERFRCALVLVGLALIRQVDGAKAATPSDERAEPIDLEALVDTATRALAPVLLPLVEVVGTLSLPPTD